MAMSNGITADWYETYRINYKRVKGGFVWAEVMLVATGEVVASCQLGSNQKDARAVVVQAWADKLLAQAEREWTGTDTPPDPSE